MYCVSSRSNLIAYNRFASNKVMSPLDKWQFKMAKMSQPSTWIRKRLCHRTCWLTFPTSTFDPWVTWIRHSFQFNPEPTPPTFFIFVKKRDVCVCGLCYFSSHYSLLRGRAWNCKRHACASLTSLPCIMYVQEQVARTFAINTKTLLKFLNSKTLWCSKRKNNPKKFFSTLIDCFA